MKNYKKIVLGALACTMIATVPVSARQISIDVLVNVDAVNGKEVLKKINEIRYDAYLNGINGLKKEDYKPLVWNNYDSTRYRAKDLSVYYGRNYLNDKSETDKYGVGEKYRENIGKGKVKELLDKWQKEKAAFLSNSKNPFDYSDYLNIISKDAKSINLSSVNGYVVLRLFNYFDEYDKDGAPIIKEEKNVKVSTSHDTDYGKTIGLIGVKNLKVGEKTKIMPVVEFNVKNSLGENQKTTGFVYENVTFNSSDPYVASVDKEGNVIAKKAGKVKLMAVSTDFKSDIYELEVTDPNNKNSQDNKKSEKVTSIGINGIQDLKVGDKGKFKAFANITGNDEKGNKANRVADIDGKVDFISSNPKVVAVDGFGNYVALKSGKAKISVKVNDFVSPEYEVEVQDEKKLQKNNIGGISKQVINKKIESDIKRAKSHKYMSKYDMYRVYNPNNHEHLYTADYEEVMALVERGWGRYEGIAWKASNKGEPVFRLYNPILKDHHYTKDRNEVVALVRNHNWQYEGIAWNSDGKKPVYRLFHPGLTSGSHHYTLDVHEVNVLQNRGWRYEGIAWYGL